MPKKSFGSSSRLMAWESHLLDLIVRFSFGVTSRHCHEFLLNIYECHQNAITIRDVQKSLSYLFTLGLIKKKAGKFYPSDSGVSFALWIFQVNSLKQEYFLQSTKSFPLFDQDEFYEDNSDDPDEFYPGAIIIS